MKKILLISTYFLSNIIWGVTSSALEEKFYGEYKLISPIVPAEPWQIQGITLSKNVEPQFQGKPVFTNHIAIGSKTSSAVYKVLNDYDHDSCGYWCFLHPTLVDQGAFVLSLGDDPVVSLIPQSDGIIQMNIYYDLPGQSTKSLKLEKKN